MGNRKIKVKTNYRRVVLRLPDLDHSKMAVLNSLHVSQFAPGLPQYAIDQFIAWYCSRSRVWPSTTL